MLTCLFFIFFLTLDNAGYLLTFAFTRLGRTPPALQLTQVQQWHRSSHCWKQYKQPCDLLSVLVINVYAFFIGWVWLPAECMVILLHATMCCEQPLNEIDDAALCSRSPHPVENFTSMWKNAKIHFLIVDISPKLVTALYKKKDS